MNRLVKISLPGLFVISLIISTIFLSFSFIFPHIIRSQSNSELSIVGQPGNEVFVAHKTNSEAPIIYNFEIGKDFIGLSDGMKPEDVSITMWPGGHTLLTYKGPPQAALFIVWDIAPWDFDTSWLLPLRYTSSATQPPSNPNPETPQPPQPPTDPQYPISDEILKQWEDEMIQYGTRNGEYYLQNTTTADLISIDSYWDAQRVFEQMAKYTGDPKFYEYSDAAQIAYAQKYVIPSGYVVNAYRVHTEGLAMKYERTGDVQAQQTLYGLAENGLYIRPETPIDELTSLNRNREAAYSLKAYINSERAGKPQHPRRNELVEVVLGHLDQVIAKDNPNPPAIKAFMTALSIESLIEYYEYTGSSDVRIPDKIYQTLDVLWQRGYDSQSGSMKYWSSIPQAWQDTDKACVTFTPEPQYPACLTNPTPDLNLIIAPAYAWAWKQTKEDRFRIRGDQLFKVGVEDNNDGLKQINQKYWWSFKYVEWRKN